MTLCYCKQEIPDGARKIVVTVAVDWGKDDLRDPQEPKSYAFDKFACVADWANDRALSHDGIVVLEGAPT